MGIFTRRRFVCGMTAATLSVPTFLRSIRAEAASPYIFVICQFDGGNDGYNTVLYLPEYATGYQGQRANIAIPLTPSDPHNGLATDVQTAGTAFDPTTANPPSSNSQYAFNPYMPELRAMYGQGDVAVIAGVGLPPTELSREGHEQAKFDQYTGTINSFDDINNGWFGTAIDQLNIPGGVLPSMLSLNGSLPLTMRGVTSVPLVIGSQNLSQVSPNVGPSGSVGFADIKLDGAYANAAMPAEFARALQNATLTYVSQLNAYGNAVPASTYNTTYTSPGGSSNTSYLGSQLNQVARLILAGAPTKGYYVYTGGFDSHSGQNPGQSDLLGDFSQATSQFFTFLKAQNPGIAQNVVLMTFSDFGRRAYSNSTAGTDHGTATVHFVMGPPVKGGVYGAWASMSNLDGNGDTLIQVDFRNQLSDIIQAMGADPTPIVGKTYPKLGFI